MTTTKTRAKESGRRAAALATDVGKKAAKRVAPAKAGSKSAQGQGDPAPVTSATAEPGAPEPTENRPARNPRKTTARDTKPATETKPKRPHKPKGEGA